MSNTSEKEERRLVETYIDAVWDYFMEHSDLTSGGAFFVKFHTDNKRTFNRRILARIRGYHRSDPIEKNRKGEELQAKMLSQKQLKQQRWEERQRKTFKNKLRSLLIKLANYL